MNAGEVQCCTAVLMFIKSLLLTRKCTRAVVDDVIGGSDCTDKAQTQALCMMLEGAQVLQVALRMKNATLPLNSPPPLIEGSTTSAPTPHAR